MTETEISKHLISLANPAIAAHSSRYFKTGKGEYGEGDQFLGIRVPVLRAQLKRCGVVAPGELKKLLMSDFHEIRLFALLLLVRQFAHGNAEQQADIYRLYLHHTHRINNWDLVDSSAGQIVGGYLAGRDRKILYELARSANLWERRIAVIATFHFIDQHQFDDALRLAKMLLDDGEDLMHKAVGWMLREVGKCDLAVEQEFLQAHYKNMPRTMLRYAIEKFPEPLRKRYLAGDV